ncbi:MAG: O-antigen ligase family protein [Alphaproteobacteria bacterium]|nr:O-antigen ligase family protein [Alphaproteobacteria bacterium]
MNLKVPQKHQETIICILVFALCPLAFFFSRSATWILTIGGIFGFLVVKKTIFHIISHPFLLGALSLIAFGGLSSLWSVDPLTSLSLTVRLFGNFILGISWCALLLQQPSESIQKILHFLIVGVCVAALLLLADYLLHNPWQSLLNISSAKAFVPLAIMLTIAAWPIAVWLSEKHNSVVSVLFLIGIAILLLIIDCDTAPLAILIGLIAAGISCRWIPLTARFGQIISTIFIMSLPFMIGTYLTSERIHQVNEKIHVFSHIHRLYTWQNISQKIEKKWALGYGLDTSRHETVGGEMKNWPLKKHNGEKIFIYTKAIPMHPHNAPLQWWLELGIVGALLGAFINYQCLEYVKSMQDRIKAALTLGLFINVSFIAYVNLGFWQNWWLSSLWILGGLMISLVRSNRLEHSTK